MYGDLETLPVEDEEPLEGGLFDDVAEATEGEL